MFCYFFYVEEIGRGGGGLLNKSISFVAPFALFNVKNGLFSCVLGKLCFFLKYASKDEKLWTFGKLKKRYEKNSQTFCQMPQSFGKVPKV